MRDKEGWQKQLKQNFKRQGKLRLSNNNLPDESFKCHLQEWKFMGFQWCLYRDRTLERAILVD